MKPKKDFNSYTLLEQLCKERNLQSSFTPAEEPITPRAEFVISTLKDIGKRVKLDFFDGSRTHRTMELDEEKAKAKNSNKKMQSVLDIDSFLEFDTEEEVTEKDLQNAKSEEEINALLDRMNKVRTFDMSLYKEVITEIKGQYLNIEVKFSAKKKTDNSIIYIAHHDVFDNNSDNCNDNSASVCNLLQFANELKGKKLDKNIYIVFTDCEEFGGRGAKQLANKINNGDFGVVEYVVNLELSALGQFIWVENTLRESSLVKKLKEVQENNQNTYYSFNVPFNDSVILRKNEIDSICIGTINNEDVNYLTNTFTKGRGCRTWSVCHQKIDIFELANEKDMNDFVSFLHSLK